MGTWATVFERLPLRGDIVPVWSHTDETGTYACIRLKLKPALVLLGLEPAQRGERRGSMRNVRWNQTQRRST